MGDVSTTVLIFDRIPCYEVDSVLVDVDSSFEHVDEKTNITYFVSRRKVVDAGCFRRRCAGCCC